MLGAPSSVHSAENPPRSSTCVGIQKYECANINAPETTRSSVIGVLASPHGSLAGILPALTLPSPLKLSLPTAQSDRIFEELSLVLLSFIERGLGCGRRTRSRACSLPAAAAQRACHTGPAPPPRIPCSHQIPATASCQRPAPRRHNKDEGAGIMFLQIVSC